ncbi:MAG: hypothetical protein R3203_00040 [Pseudoalteromonas tetraodonis]|nr:hypothetical protein [Pseudoalteromonas tetraodonis]
MSRSSNNTSMDGLFDWKWYFSFHQVDDQKVQPLVSAYRKIDYGYINWDIEVQYEHHVVPTHAYITVHMVRTSVIEELQSLHSRFKASLPLCDRR